MRKLINFREDLVNVCDQDGRGLGIQVIKMDDAEIVIGRAQRAPASASGRTSSTTKPR
jgi:hypothetical protein